jgi:hypothetical protein
LEIAEYCRQIETYLCRKNDGHLIRISGPSFDIVTGWVERGVPLKVACRGIDRYFDRYYSKGPRRRPVRIDFCDADVLDVFDEWRRATGLPAAAGGDIEAGSGAPARRGVSLPTHLERVLMRLTAARVSGTLDRAFDDLLDRVAHELEGARGTRGEKRQALIARLALIDQELIEAARATIDEPSAAAIEREADEELTGFRSTMTGEAFARAREAAIARLVRERLHLPTVAFS